MKEIEKFIKQYFIDNDIPLIFNNYDTVKISIYGYRACNTNNYQYSKFWKLYFPKKKPKQKLAYYILNLKNKKYCSKCGKIRYIKDFSKAKNRSDGLQGKCKFCETNWKVHYREQNKERLNEYTKNWSKNNREKRNNTQAKRRAAKIQRTPTWADQEAIKFFYECCPEGYHVDHIIPLQGKNISGLHIETNLQWLPAEENLRKGNTWEDI